MRYNKIYEKCVLSLFEKFFLVTVAAAAQEAEHVEVSSSDKPNPKSLLMSGRPPAWRPPPSLYECVCERVNVSVVKVLWAIRRLERCRAKCMNLPYSSPHFSDKIIAYFTGAIFKHGINEEGDVWGEDPNHFVCETLRRTRRQHPPVPLFPKCREKQKQTDENEIRHLSWSWGALIECKWAASKSCVRD